MMMWSGASLVMPADQHRGTRKLAKEIEFEAGYRRVRTPHLAKESMYLTSGHHPLCGKHVPSHGVGRRCRRGWAGAGQGALLPHGHERPHHHKIFSATPRSYREFLRLAEYGTCYRYEHREPMGLMRVRSMQMNDATFTARLINSRITKAVNEMYLKYFKVFGFEKYQMRFKR